MSAAGFAVVVFGLVTDRFFIMWFGWGMIFLFLEAYALFRRAPEDTLSEQVQKGTLSRSGLWNAVWKSLVGALIVWLFFHLVFGL